MKKSFAGSAAVLAVIGIIAKLIGALYRVPLTNIIGAEGMGLYQMVFPLYTVLLAFCGGGVTGAMSRVVAKYTAHGDNATALRVTRAAMLPLIGVSVALTAAVALLRNVISGMQGNTDAGIAYLALCPSLLFASGISVLRGYFQGKSLMLPSGVSQLVEQAIKLALGLTLSRAMLSLGVPYAVAGALLGVTVSELFALLYLAIRFAVHKHKRKRFVSLRAATAEHAEDVVLPIGEPSSRALIKELYGFALPVTLGSLVLPITQMIDSALVINILMYCGVTRVDATALFGLFVGPVGTLINMPAVVILSVSVAFLPALTTAIENADKKAVSDMTRSAVRWIMLFVIPVAVAFFAFPDRIVGALYRRGLTPEQLTVAARLLRIQAVSVFYLGALQFGTTVLQANNRSHRPVINLVIGACAKVALTPVLVRVLGIEGACASTAVCYALAATLTVISAYRCGEIGASAVDCFILPVVFSAAACGAFIAAAMLLAGTSLPYLWQTVFAAVAFVIVYGCVVFIRADVRASTIKLVRSIKRPRKKNDKKV